MSEDQGTESVEPAPAPRVSWRRIGAAATAVAALALIGAALWIAAPLFPPISAGITTTTGRIYVESPEVYTRERLVNDRYRQDFWLRAQLDALDASDALIGSVETSRLDVGPRPDRQAAPRPRRSPFARSSCCARRSATRSGSSCSRTCSTTATT